jgi:hypothetical protein
MRQVLGRCKCGGPSVTGKDPETGYTTRICDRCSLPTRLCKCPDTVPVYCKSCGELEGHRAEDSGTFYPRDARGHRCKER